MSLMVVVSYEPDGSPSLSDRALELQVSRLQSGEDLCRDAYERIKGELTKPISEYALYWPQQKVWIDPVKQVGLQRLDNGTRLELKPKTKHRKIRFLDASSKLVKVEETQPVKEIVRDLCMQLQLEHPEELSLVVAGDYAVTKHHPAKAMVKRVESASPSLGRRTFAVGSSISRAARGGIASKESQAKDSPTLSPNIRRSRAHRPGSAGRSKWGASRVRKQISKKHQIRLDTPWLDPNKTLAEQEVTERDELILMYRFYYYMELQRDSPKLEMLYKQARVTYLAGELLCSVNDTIRLSAILCQIRSGDYATHKYNPDFLVQISKLIAPPKCKVKAIAKQILAEHASLKGLSAADAKAWFVKLWSSLELFGFEFLSCTNIDTREKGLIGVSKHRILFLMHKKKKNLSWDIDTLVQWRHLDLSRETVSLTFSHDGNTQVLNLQLPDYTGVLMDCLQGHSEVADLVPDMSRVVREYQFDEELEKAISDVAAQTKTAVEDRRPLNSLTYEQVYWASKIDNPLISDEELAALHTESWENPVFEHMDQLMDERFNFLDFSEYNTSETSSASTTTAMASGSSSGDSSNGSPLPSSIRTKRSSNPQCSPLVTTVRTHSPSGSPSQSPSLRADGPHKLNKGLLEGRFKGHSRAASGGNGIDRVLASVTGLESRSLPSFRAQTDNQDDTA